MVTARTLERLATKSSELAREAGTSETMVKKILKLAEKDIISRRRQPAPPPPEGGISIGAAARKYKVNQPLLSRWRQRGIIQTLLETRNEVYVSEISVSKAVELYLKSPGRGKRDVIKILTPDNLRGD